MAHPRTAGASVTRRRKCQSVLDDLVDPVNHAGDMPAELKKEGPEHLEARPILDEDRKKRQKEAEDDQEDLYHPNICRFPPGDCIVDRLIVLEVITVGISLLLLDRAQLPPFIRLTCAPKSRYRSAPQSRWLAPNGLQRELLLGV
jgi:hypothetical protein